MKKIRIAVFISLCPVILAFLSGCVITMPIGSRERYKKVEPVGEVPAELSRVVEKNLFKDADAVDGKVFMLDVISADEKNGRYEKRLIMTDAYGAELLRYDFVSSAAMYNDYYKPSSDGGVILTDTDEGQNGGEPKLTVTKLDSKGNKVYETEIASPGKTVVEVALEKDGRLYLFCTELKDLRKSTWDVYADSDIFTAMLDENGAVVKTRRYSGSDRDDLYYAEATDNGFRLYVASSSYDGDFEREESPFIEESDYIIETDLELNKTGMVKTKTPEDYPLSGVIGEEDGGPVRCYDSMFDDFDAGTPTLYIDYGDFYMVVSYNITWVNSFAPVFSLANNEHSETVYSGYDNNGGLIFRASVANN